MALHARRWQRLFGFQCFHNVTDLQGQLTLSKQREESHDSCAEGTAEILPIGS
jgi:hypothetical protein